MYTPQLKVIQQNIRIRIYAHETIYEYMYMYAYEAIYVYTYIYTHKPVTTWRQLRGWWSVTASSALVAALHPAPVGFFLVLSISIKSLGALHEPASSWHLLLPAHACAKNSAANLWKCVFVDAYVKVLSIKTCKDIDILYRRIHVSIICLCMYIYIYMLQRMYIRIRMFTSVLGCVFFYVFVYKWSIWTSIVECLHIHVYVCMYEHTNKHAYVYWNVRRFAYAIYIYQRVRVNPHLCKHLKSIPNAL